MLECKYCASVFEKLPEEGNCPKCGGPGPRRLQPEVVQVVVREYVYVPRPNAPSYYVPSRLNPVQSAYSTLGYKVVTFLMILIIAVLAISFVYWLTWRAPALPTTDESYQLSLPTAQPTSTQKADSDSGSGETWLSSSEAAELRDRENVVNLAYLDKGGALYSAQHSVPLTLLELWSKTKPLGITELTKSGTSAQFKANGYQYTVNVFQPFVLASQPAKVNVIDNEGFVWQADLADVDLESVDFVVSGLPFTIPPNPNLTYTY